MGVRVPLPRLMDNDVLLSSLSGVSWLFYGVDNNAFKIGDIVLEAIEDPSDGYRSYLGCVKVATNEGLIFHEKPIAVVRVVEKTYHFPRPFTGCVLVDANDDHVWLEVGTSDYDDYYPCFTFRYMPKVKAI